MTLLLLLLVVSVEDAVSSIMDIGCYHWSGERHIHHPIGGVYEPADSVRLVCQTSGCWDDQYQFHMHKSFFYMKNGDIMSCKDGITFYGNKNKCIDMMGDINETLAMENPMCVNRKIECTMITSTRAYCVKTCNLCNGGEIILPVEQEKGCRDGENGFHKPNTFFMEKNGDVMHCYNGLNFYGNKNNCQDMFGERNLANDANLSKMCESVKGECETSTGTRAHCVKTCNLCNSDKIILEENHLNTSNNSVDCQYSNCEQFCKDGMGCGCREGFRLKDDKIKCEDIDECTEKSDKCDHKCENNIGSYTCKCRDGYKLVSDRSSCKDIDECSESKHKCDHSCMNFIGSYSCTCNDGYKLHHNKKNCIKIIMTISPTKQISSTGNDPETSNEMPTSENYGNCTDTHTMCLGIRKAGYCESNRKAQRYCRKTCGLCRKALGEGSDYSEQGQAIKGGCIVNGKKYDFGDEIDLGCSKLICTENNNEGKLLAVNIGYVDDNSYKCGRCTLYGNGYIRTFGGSYIPWNAKCKYHVLMKGYKLPVPSDAYSMLLDYNNCSLHNTQKASCMNEFIFKSGDNSKVNFTNDLITQIKYRDKTGSLQQASLDKVTNLGDGMFIWAVKDGGIRVHSKNGISVEFREDNILVWLPESLSREAHGICGTYTSHKRDDLVSRNTGRTTDDLTDFFDSWKDGECRENNIHSKNPMDHALPDSLKVAKKECEVTIQESQVEANMVLFGMDDEDMKEKFIEMCMRNVFTCVKENLKLCMDMVKKVVKFYLLDKKRIGINRSKSTIGSKCNQHCDGFNSNNVCGNNGKTYRNLCELEMDACKNPEDIIIYAHPGPCDCFLDGVIYVHGRPMTTNDSCHQVYCDLGKAKKTLIRNNCCDLTDAVTLQDGGTMETSCGLIICNKGSSTASKSPNLCCKDKEGKYYSDGEIWTEADGSIYSCETGTSIFNGKVT